MSFYLSILIEHADYSTPFCVYLGILDPDAILPIISSDLLLYG